jgi:signal transduction histidine kinase/uncharacterized protein YhhL (DUF1145 family)
METGVSQIADSRETSSTQDVVAVNRWLSVTRVRAALALALFAGAMAFLGIGDLSWPPVALVCLVLLVFSMVALRLRLGERRPWAFLYAQTAVDCAAITIGIAFGVRGEPATLFSTLFVLTIVPAALMSIRAGLAAAVLASVGHFVILNLHRPLFEVLWTLEGIAPVFLFFMVAQQCLFYAGHLEAKNAALAQLALRLDASRRRLEELVRIARTLNSTLDAPELLRRSNQAALEQLDASSATTFLVDLQHHSFRLAAVSEGSLNENPLSRIDFPIEAFPAVARLTQDPVAALSPPEMARVPAALTGGRTLSAGWLAGLYREGTLAGFLAVGYVGAEPPAEAVVVDQLTAIAEHAAIALGNAKLLEEARAASALKSEFLSTVSHELRTPLNIIIGYIEMLRDGAAGRLTVPQSELFKRIEGGSRELFELIDSVLQVGRLDTGGAAPVLAPVSLAALLKTVEGSLGGLPRPPGVELQWVIPPGLDGTIVTDPPKVGLVLRNLVGNAFKFTSRGQVTVGIRPEETHLALEVSDTGVGIAAENIPRIFDMFRQLKGSESRGGVGLGLHIVKQLVARLGGRLEVRSELGAGSTFRVVLPRWQESAAAEDDGGEADALSASRASEPTRRLA